MTPPSSFFRVLFSGLLISSVSAAAAVFVYLRAFPAAGHLALWAAVCLSLLSIVIGVVLLFGLRSRVRYLGGVLDRLKDGDWKANIPVKSGHEMKPLLDGLNRLAETWTKRQVLVEAFRRYVDPSLADHIVRQGLTLGGETFQATILFADMRDFTELSELMTPQEMVGLLNQYFTLVEPLIHQEGGWVNKFGGDSLLAVFGAPITYPDHVERAVRASMHMRDAITDFNIRQRTGGGPILRIGMGIHCGEVVVGHVGGAKRMEYTVIGDAVNTASRIQALHRKYGKSILLSAEAYKAVKTTHPATLTLPLLIVQGKSDPIQVYAID